MIQRAVRSVAAWHSDPSHARGFKKKKSGWGREEERREGRTERGGAGVLKHGCKSSLTRLRLYVPQVMVGPVGTMRR